MLRPVCSRALLAAAALLAAPAISLAQPANDECGSATALTVDVPAIGDNHTATDSVALTGATGCTGLDGVGGTRDVFFSFTPPQRGRYRFTTCGSGFNNTLSLHSACPADSSNVVVCSSVHSSGPCSSTNTASFQTVLTNLDTLYLRLAGENAQTGVYNMTVTLLEAFPTNDDCATPITVSEGDTNVLSFSLANGTDITPCVTGDAVDVWYSFTAPTAGSYQFAAMFPPIEPSRPVQYIETATIALYDTCGGPAVECGAYRAYRQLAENQTVLIRFAGTTPASPLLRITQSSPPTPPVNDTCENALPYFRLDGAPVASADGATADHVTWCTPAGGPATRGVWYKFTATDSNWLMFFNFYNPYQTPYYGLSLYRGECGSLVQMGCSTGSSITAEVPYGQSVYLLFGRPDGENGVAISNITSADFSSRQTGACCSANGCTLTTRGTCPNAATSWSPDVCRASPTANIYTVNPASPLTIPNGAPLLSTVNVPQDYIVGTVAVSLTINHPNMSDLEVRLTRPGLAVTPTSGSVVVHRRGGSADLAGTYVFSDAGARGPGQVLLDAPAAVLAPGTYRTSSSTGMETGFSRNFNLRAALGDWTLSITDVTGADVGELVSWSLVINPLATNPCAPPCRANFDGSADGVQVADIFAFLSAWFAQSPSANFDGSADGVQVADIFAFLSAWFAGCP